MPIGLHGETVAQPQPSDGHQIMPIGLPSETGRPATTIRWAPNHGRQSVFRRERRLATTIRWAPNHANRSSPSPSHNHPMDTKSPIGLHGETGRLATTIRWAPNHGRRSVFTARRVAQPQPSDGLQIMGANRSSRRDGSPSHIHPMGTKSSCVPQVPHFDLRVRRYAASSPICLIRSFRSSRSRLISM